MPQSRDFEPVFQRLKAILQPYATSMRVQTDTPSNYLLYAPNPGPNKRPLSFAAVEIKKNYVSYHLVPVYLNPSLLEDISPELKKRMQGRGCFNFVEVDEGLFGELGELTGRGMEWYRVEGYVD